MTRHFFLETLEALYINICTTQILQSTLFTILMAISSSEAVEVVLLSFERKYHMDVSFTITMALTQYPPLAGGFSPAKFTRNCLPSCSAPSKLLIASVTSSAEARVTNPKPLDLPVSRSLITFASKTFP
jgi:hypothetical protein